MALRINRRVDEGIHLAYPDGLEIMFWREPVENEKHDQMTFAKRLTADDEFIEFDRSPAFLHHSYELPDDVIVNYERSSYKTGWAKFFVTASKRIIISRSEDIRYADDCLKELLAS